MSLTSILLTIFVILGVCLGVLRPSGIAGRTEEEREADERRDLASKWLDKTDKHE
jgi:hypothetical protein